MILVVCTVSILEHMYIIMRCKNIKQRVDPVLAPDQFSVARPLRPEDLDRQVTQHGIYPLLPAPNGVPCSKYVQTTEE